MSRFIISALSAALVLVFASTASSQQVSAFRPQVSAGYQLLHIPDETFPIGFSVDVSGRGTGLTWVGEFGWAHDDQTEPGVDGTLTFLDYGIGPRWNASTTGLRPFAQILAGGVTTSAKLTTGGAPANDTDHAFMLQPGAGVFVPVSAMWGVVGQADYRHAFFKEEGDDEFRLFIGVRFSTGR